MGPVVGGWGGHGEVGLGLGVCTGCGGAGGGVGGGGEVGGLQSMVWVVMVRFGLCSRRVDGGTCTGFAYTRDAMLVAARKLTTS